MPNRKRFEMRVPASFLKMVDDWRRRQPELPFRGHPPFGRARAEGEAQKDIGSMVRKLKYARWSFAEGRRVLELAKQSRSLEESAGDKNPATGKKDVVWFALDRSECSR